jgi:hypothetical protein
MLKSGYSPAAFSHNVSTEVAAGRPQPQAVAIAYKKKREAQRKAGKKVDPGPKK